MNEHPAADRIMSRLKEEQGGIQDEADFITVLEDIIEELEDYIE